MKDGQVVGTETVDNLTTPRLIQMMVGRELSEIYPKRQPKFGREALAVRHLTREGVLHDVSLSVREGEILGIAGLAGSGRTEVLRAILGAGPLDGGQIEIYGQLARIESPQQAIEYGIGLLPEDAKPKGYCCASASGSMSPLPASIPMPQAVCCACLLSGRRRRNTLSA